MAPVRRAGSSPILSVEVAPAYELLMSMVTASDSRDADTYEVGPEWLDATRRRAGEDLLRRLDEAAVGNEDAWIHLLSLAYDSPAPRDVDAFLGHLRDTDPVELRLHLLGYYDPETRRMTPEAVIRRAVEGDPDATAELLRTSHPEWEPWQTYLRDLLARDPAEHKAQIVGVIEDWASVIWAPESDAILPILERDAAAKREQVREQPLERFVETATNGVGFAPRPGINRVVMVPSWVNRPLVSYTTLCDAMIIIYPVADESLSADTDTPPLRLIRLSKALGDEKRLRILRVLANGEMGLMELAEQFGVAKTTMHHHLIVLRSAGLVSVSVGSKRYRLRRDTVPDVGQLLSGYLGALTGPSEAPGPAPAAPRVASPAATRRRSRRRAVASRS